MKLSIKIVSLTLAAIFPILLLFSVAFLTRSEFDESFVGALDDKLDRLYSIEEEKIVIIGGSSAAFGYDSEIIENHLDMPVVNMGLYAALGTKLMLDLSRDAIREGDIVIIAPELDSQTLSLYFNASTTLKALDSSRHYLWDIPSEHRASLLGASFEFASEKLSYKIFGAPEFDGIYSSKSFNERGDIEVYRAENIMQEYYDENLPIRLDSDIFDSDFVEYLNEYISYCKSVGANVYFEFCPMNRMGLDEFTSTKEAFSRFEKYIKKNIDCTLIASDIEDYIYEEGYFYDSNFHLNSAGATMHTVNVTRDLLLELGINKAIGVEIPSPPALPEIEVRWTDYDENSECFEYAKMENGAYMIVGVKEEYLKRDSLTVPLGYDGYKVMAIGPRFLEGSSVTTLILTERTNIRHFATGAFIGAASLKDMYIYYPAEEDIMPPADFVGTSLEFKVYIPENSGYKSGYFWSERGLKFEYISD